MYEVKDAMTREFLSISPDASVHDAIELLLDRNISGVPVLDGAGRIVGMITQFQLLEVLYDPNVENKRVYDFMTKRLITIGEGDMLARAAGLMVLHRIRRLPVLREGELVGIISRGDLLRYFRKTGQIFSHACEDLRSLQETPAEALTAV